MRKPLIFFILTLPLLAGCGTTECDSPQQTQSELKVKIQQMYSELEAFADGFRQEAIQYWNEEKPNDSICGRYEGEGDSQLYCEYTAIHQKFSAIELDSLKKDYANTIKKLDVLQTTYPKCFDSSDVVDSKIKLSN